MAKELSVDAVGSPPEPNDYAAWLRRMLLVALDGGPHVPSARSLAEQHRRHAEIDSGVRAAIDGTSRAFFLPAELRRVAHLIDPTNALDDAQRISLARWVVKARLATTIALICGHDPEQAWVEAAIHDSVDGTLIQEYARQQDREWVEKGLEEIHGLLQEEEAQQFVASEAAKKIFKGKYGPAIAMVVKVLVAIAKPVARAIVSRVEARRCKKTVGMRAQRLFRYLALPSTTER